MDEISIKGCHRQLRVLWRFDSEGVELKGLEPTLAGSECISGYNNAVSAAKTLRLLLGGTSDAAIRFDGLCSLLAGLGFEKRVKGGHHLFRKTGVEERINLQRDGSHAKPYQVKHVRARDTEMQAW